MKTNWPLWMFSVWILYLLFASLHTPQPGFIMTRGKQFKVYYDRNYPDHMQESDINGNKTIGTTDCKAAVIQIDPDESFTDIRDTLWHEAKHAANKCTTLTWRFVENIDFDYDNLYEFQNPEEINLLRENPLLKDYITARRMPWQK